MQQHITQYEISRKCGFSHGGMAPPYALRNIADVSRQGLKNARKRADISQQVVAERMGVSVPQISRWETGRDGIPSQRVPAMLEAYRATLDELFDAEDGPVIEAPAEIQVDPETLAPLLAALLRASPPGPISEPKLRWLSTQLAYGLGLLGFRPPGPVSSDAIQVAVRGMVQKSNEIELQ
jgi:transcriptional regulator with XRE-family HTH domain